jgi:SAM-dependent methyltransferase
MSIFFEVHKDLPREAPGDNGSTLKAFLLLSELPANPIILDIGCGPGMQTLLLANQAGARVVALDNHHYFLTCLQDKVRTQALNNRLSLTNASMFDLPFAQCSFDCIWSEGAIYIMGLEMGLPYLKSLLKPGGYLAFTEISWIKPNHPDEVTSYWQTEYPAIRSMPENLKIIQASGYNVIAHFILPTSSWWNDYYTPMENRLPLLLEKFKDYPEVGDTFAAVRKEIEMYRKYSDYYGYVFYITKAA